jgi:DNA-binding beta-propeller fold protein YncE
MKSILASEPKRAAEDFSRRFSIHLVVWAVFVLAALLLSNVYVIAQEESPSFSAPAGIEFAKVVPGGDSILPNGRLLAPRGVRLYTGEDLWNVLPSPDGKWWVGLCDAGMVIYRANAKSAMTNSLLIPWTKAAFCGAFTADSQRFITSSGDFGHGIQIWDTDSWNVVPTTRLQKLDLAPTRTIAADAESYINDLVLSADERFVFGADVARQKVITFDLVEGIVCGEAEAGREPFSLAISKENRKIFVANIGIFDYSLIPQGTGDPRGITTPAFGFPSLEAENGVEKEGRFVPGLGDAQVASAHSVWRFDVDNPAKPTVEGKVKTGVLIQAPAGDGKVVGGSSPNGLIVYGKTLVVSNANNDSIQYVDVDSLSITRTIHLEPQPLLAGLRGAIPTGMCIDSKGKFLYVCAAGLNAIAVVDFQEAKIVNWIPTGWFPTSCKLTSDESHLLVSTQKGIGRGPRGDKHGRSEEDERFGLAEMPGMIQVVNLADLPDGTATVLRNNGMVPDESPSLKFPEEIKYVVFITKENHTFDGIFGGLPGSTSEPEYAEFGRQGWIKEKGRQERVPIMPNHIKLAEQFSISDNFYMEPQASGDGHRWLVGIYPSFWTTRVFYSGWGFRKSETAPGRMVAMTSNGSQIPEDYLENGSMFEHLNRGEITFRNYGEGFEFPDNDEGPTTNRSGAFTQVNYPMPKVLFDNTDFDFPAYNTNIPDIARADWFVEDIEQYRREHEGKLPRFLNIAICNDHGASPAPEKGYPFVASYMADNDLALGKIVAYLSSQPEWKNMAIFVTQDDSGGDNDSIDRHRSFVLCISPFAKKGYVSHRHTSIMSAIKSIYRIFDLGPNNLFDATATDLADMFTNTPNYEAYKYVAPDPRVFKPEETFDPTDPKFERRRREGPVVKMDDPDFVESLREDK